MSWKNVHFAASVFKTSGNHLVTGTSVECLDNETVLLLQSFLFLGRIERMQKSALIAGTASTAKIVWRHNIVATHYQGDWMSL
jgi:hypothetical protein